MKTKAASAKIKVLFAFLVLLLAACAASSQSPSVNDPSSLPAPTGFVNDYAGVIDAGTKQQLEQKIKAFKEKTNPSVELAVAVVKTTGERDIFDYSLAIARNWKIGSKDDDNPSALLFIAVDDHKYFTQVSKDLEDELPDGVVGSLQRQYLVPEFRKGNYAKGISDTIDAYIATIQAKTSGNPTPTPKAGGTVGSAAGSSIFSIICCLIVIGVILLIIFSRAGRGGPSSNDRNRWGGGGGGFGGGGALPWIVGGILGSGSGSSSSGSSWGGGGSDWGGFGGGGDFGGGGAGGSW